MHSFEPHSNSNSVEWRGNGARTKSFADNLPLQHTAYGTKRNAMQSIMFYVDWWEHSDWGALDCLQSVIILFCVFCLSPFSNNRSWYCMQSNVKWFCLKNVAYVDSTKKLLGSASRTTIRPNPPPAEGNGDFEYGSIFMHDFLFAHSNNNNDSVYFRLALKFSSLLISKLLFAFDFILNIVRISLIAFWISRRRLISRLRRCSYETDIRIRMPTLYGSVLPYQPQDVKGGEQHNCDPNQNQMKTKSKQTR